MVKFFSNIFIVMKKRLLFFKMYQFNNHFKYFTTIWSNLWFKSLNIHYIYYHEAKFTFLQDILVWLLFQRLNKLKLLNSNWFTRGLYVFRIAIGISYWRSFHVEKLKYNSLALKLVNYIIFYYFQDILHTVRLYGIQLTVVYFVSVFGDAIFPKIYTKAWIHILIVYWFIVIYRKEKSRRNYTKQNGSFKMIIWLTNIIGYLKEKFFYMFKVFIFPLYHASNKFKSDMNFRWKYK